MLLYFPAIIAAKVRVNAFTLSSPNCLACSYPGPRGLRPILSELESTPCDDAFPMPSSRNCNPVNNSPYLAAAAVPQTRPPSLPTAVRPLRQNSALSLKRYHYNPMISQNGWYIVAGKRDVDERQIRPSFA
jgi:hypothetical protein